MGIKLNLVQQTDMLNYITETLNNYESQTEDYRQQNLEIYEALSTFTEPNTGWNLPRYKVNLMHIILRQVVPRIIANAPRPQVVVRTDKFFAWDEDARWEKRAKILARNNKLAQAMQDYLTVVFNKEQMKERLKYWAINQLTYWEGFAQVVPKYKVQRSKVNTVNWQKVTEKMIEVTPSIDVISFSEIFYDPRFKLMEDMPWVFRVKEGVRMRDILMATKDDGSAKYFNLEELQKLGNTKFQSTAKYKQEIYSITGIDWVEVDSGINKNALTLQTFYGYYSITGDAKDERIYEITTIDKALIIGIEEITKIPILDIKGHEDPEVYKSVWLLAPIIGVQNEMNYQKNSRATAMSKSLNRDYIWSADSGLDPAGLVWGQWGKIHYASKGLKAALDGFQEMQDRPLDSSYFSDINDLNRDAQRLTHTTDVSQPKWQTNLTNTATGAKISFFESNSVIAELRKNFERGVQEMWMAILQWTFENIEKEVNIKRASDGKFFKINKEAFRDALERYDIKIEANSSSYDDVESRRDDALAMKNIALEAAQAGVPIDLNESFKKIFSTFENVDVNELIKQEEITPESIWAVPTGAKVPERPTSEAAKIVEWVVGGWLTEWL